MDQRQRDPEQEQQERDRFAILLHLWTLSSDGLSAIARESIARTLALGTEEARALVDGLIYQSFLVPVGGGTRVSLSSLGDYYVRFGAGRRRSLRFPLRGR